MLQKKKRKMNFPAFILILNGPVCAGKTSVARYFYSKYKNIFTARGDKIKWMISDYDRLNLNYKENIVEMVSTLIQSAIKCGFSIVHDWSITNKQRIKYKKLAKQYGLIFMEVNIESDFCTISKRFDERIVAAKKGAKISLTDPKIMKKRYEDYFNLKKEDLPTFDSGKLSPEEISKKIISLIKKV